MTRNVKKLLAVVLVLAMAGSTMIVAWANSPTGQATIQFLGTWETGVTSPEGPGVTPPPTPPETDAPEDGDPVGPPPTGPGSPEEPITNPGNELNPPDQMADINLHFHTHDPTHVRSVGGDINFNSVRARNGPWDNQLAGHAVRGIHHRQNGNISLAGVWVRTHDTQWTVDVYIAPFDAGLMEGFSMGIQPRGEHFGPIGNGLGDNAAVSFTPIPTTGLGSLTASTSARLMSHNAAADDWTFVGGRHFEATLRIPRQNVPADEATPSAQMTWIFNSGNPRS